jgi:hypothetical protein
MDFDCAIGRWPQAHVRAIIFTQLNCVSQLSPTHLIGVNYGNELHFP